MTSQRANILAHVSHFLFAGGVAFEIRTKQRSQNIATRPACRHSSTWQTSMFLMSFSRNTRVSRSTFSIAKVRGGMKWKIEY